MLLMILSIASVIPVQATNKYAAVVFPVRSRELWRDRSLEPMREQYRIIKNSGMAATWLLQYDALKDEELLSEIKEFDGQQERGIFLEVSKRLADESRVIYPIGKTWYDPGAVFLSGYTRTERRKMIDKAWKEFKNAFGYYPESIGAWWIDSYSLEYIENKYGVTTVMIVADQKSTDGYGVWGQWWGVPYFPSKANILAPAQEESDKAGPVIIQWALRDPELGYGEGGASLYSLQANDYIQIGGDIDYFKKIAGQYLENENKIGQITVGLETGMESVGMEEEFNKQIKTIKDWPNLEVVSMSRFGEKWKNTYKNNPGGVVINNWVMSRDGRKNESLKEETIYNRKISFADYFVKDKNSFLDRVLINDKTKAKTYIPYWLLVAAIFLSIGLVKRNMRNGIIMGLVWGGLAFGLLWKSGYQYGWGVFYGAVVTNIEVAQVVSVMFAVVVGIIFWKKNIRWEMAAVFAIDFVLSIIRITSWEGKYMAGAAVDAFRFVGGGITKEIKFSLVNQDFPGYVMESMLKLDFDNIWSSWQIGLIIYPAVHIVLTVILTFILARLPKYIRIGVTAIMISLAVLWGWQIILAEPRLVTS